MSFTAQFGLEVEGVGAVEVDVVVLRGCQVRPVFVGDGLAVGSKGVERVAEVGRGPQHGGVGDQGEAQRLVDLVIEVQSPDVALVGEEQIAAQGVQARRCSTGGGLGAARRVEIATGRRRDADCSADALARPGSFRRDAWSTSHRCGKELQGMPNDTMARIAVDGSRINLGGDSRRRWTLRCRPLGPSPERGATRVVPAVMPPVRRASTCSG